MTKSEFINFVWNAYNTEGNGKDFKIEIGGVVIMEGLVTDLRTKAGTDVQMTMIPVGETEERLYSLEGIWYENFG